MNKINIKNRHLENKNHELRDVGIVPGILYGPTVKNTAIQLSSKELRKVTSNPGEVYEVSQKNRTVFVKFGEIQTDPVSHDFIHFSLVQMPKGVENEVEVPVSFKGTPIGVKKGGTLLVMKDEIKVNGKPRAIPENVEVNITNLDIGDKITIDDLRIPKKINAIDDDSEIVAICQPPMLKEAFVDAEELDRGNSEFQQVI